MTGSLEATINAAWEERTTLSATTQGAVRKAVDDALAALDSGALRVAQKETSGAWAVNQWLKKAVLIGKHCHLSGGVGIGGVLEPLQANPVIIEDNCFVGARSEVAEGVIVREGSVIGMGVYLGQSTPIVNRATGETLFGEVPPYSVVVAGNRPGSQPMPGQNWTPSLYCAVIVKQVDAGTRAKTSVNELLRA